MIYIQPNNIYGSPIYPYFINTKGRKARNTTMNNNIDFDRFINVMADLITKYADKIDLDNLPDVKMPEAGTSKVSASFLHLWGKYRLSVSRVQNIEVFRCF